MAVLFTHNKPGTPVRRICNTGDLNRVFDILEGITGRGCSIDKTNPKNWTINVGADSEGQQLDDNGGGGDPPPGYVPPSEAAAQKVADLLHEEAEKTGDPTLAEMADAIEDALSGKAAARNPPPCGNPLNDPSGEEPELDDNDYNPLDHEGYGGYTPLCAGELRKTA